MSGTGLSYYAIRGDQNAQLERWALTGLADAWTDSGILHASLSESGGTRLVELFRRSTKLSADKVCSGTTTSDESTVTLSQANSSGVSGSVYLRQYQAADTSLRLICYLATDADLMIREWDLDSWYPDSNGDGVLDSSFQALHRVVMRYFVERLIAEHPPLLSGRAHRSFTSRYGIWRKESNGDWCLSGLHNIEAFRSWAIAYTLSLIFKSRISREGEMAALRHAAYKTEADEVWARTVIAEDLDRDMDADWHYTGFRARRG